MSPFFGQTEPLEEDIDLESVPVVPSTQEDVMAILEGLPSGFTKDYDYGLGLAKPYRFIINAVEKLTQCTGIVISSKIETQISEKEKIFYISFDDFEEARKSINTNITRNQKDTRSLHESLTYNLFAKRIGQPKKTNKAWTALVAKTTYECFREPGTTIKK